jgi:hypothetical protein
MKDKYDLSKSQHGRFFSAGVRFAKARLAQLAAKLDSKNDVSDIPEADEAFFNRRSTMCHEARATNNGADSSLRLRGCRICGRARKRAFH